MIAEFELTEFILGFVAVRKPREDCEKAVKRKANFHPLEHIISENCQPIHVRLPDLQIR
jgi:hypothetical protein